MRGRRTPEASRVVDRMGFRRVRVLILAALTGMAVAGAVPAAAQPGSASLASLDRGGAPAAVPASFDAAGSTTLWSAPGSLFGSLTPRVSVVDVNAAPSFSDTDYPGDAASRTVEESTTSGNLGAPITATDPENDTLTYSVAATDARNGAARLATFNSDFSLNAATGQITVKATATINYLSTNSYEVTYEVSDRKGAAGTPDTAVDDSLTLTINVTDVAVANFLTIDDVTVTEPATGTGTVTFTVGLSPALPAGSSPESVSATTGRGIDPPIHWAGRHDFLDVEEKWLTFNAGETSKTITVPVLGDSLDEWDEVFFVTLEAPQGPLGFAGGKKELAGNATILDSDVPVASISASEALEGEPAALTIILDIPSSRDLEVEYSTPARLSNTAGATDYTAVPFGTSVLVPTGRTSVSVQVQTTEDTVAEVDEKFTVRVDAVILASSPRVVVGNRSATRGAATVTILDDEPRAVDGGGGVDVGGGGVDVGGGGGVDVGGGGGGGGGGVDVGGGDSGDGDVPQETAPVFADVDPASVHAPHIDALAAAGITVGCAVTPPLRFCPDQPVTRAQMATFLTRALNLTPTDTAGFADVDPASVHAPHIDALAAAGITVGCAVTPPLRFCPDQPVTRAQMATFLTRALNLTPTDTAGFADVDPASVHAPHIDALAAAGITVGCAVTPPLRFCPDQPVTRAQMATFLTRALDL